MRLPNTENAEIPRAKIVDYLLSLSHPDGRGKAIFFMGFGFSLEAWETLGSALREHAVRNDVTKVEPTPFGTRYVVEGSLMAPDGRTPNVRVVWFVENGASMPRFVTAYPLDSSPTPNSLPEQERNEAMVQELDRVVLQTDLPEYGLLAGDVGTVVLVHAGGKGYEAEFVALNGETIAVVSVSAEQVRPVRRFEMAHVRELATA
jgi:hypothetical protein